MQKRLFHRGLSIGYLHPDELVAKVKQAAAGAERNMSRHLVSYSRLPVEIESKNRAKAGVAFARSLANSWLSFPQNGLI
jgi:hypothetical protein